MPAKQSPIPPHPSNPADVFPRRVTVPPSVVDRRRKAARALERQLVASCDATISETEAAFAYLVELHPKLGKSYAADLIESMVGRSAFGLDVEGDDDCTATVEDCDALVRSLVVDHYFDRDEAALAYKHALVAVGEVHL